MIMINRKNRIKLTHTHPLFELSIWYRVYSVSLPVLIFLVFRYRYLQIKTLVNTGNKPVYSIPVSGTTFPVFRYRYQTVLILVMSFG
ncbi:hypothetical protein Hanom_Chr07g00675651 [Helianthus anomalus]